MPGIDDFTVLCLHGDGADASTSFPDAARSHAMTARGNAQVDTAQSKFGGSAILLDGTGDWVDTPDHADWDFGAGDFTIDTFARFNSVPGGAAACFLSQWVITGNQQAWRLEYNPFTAGFHFEYSTTGADNPQFSKTWAPSTSTWYHIAVVRFGNSFYCFVDGTQLGSTDTLSATIFNSNAVLQIGARDGGDNFNGWLDEVRISKGIARWTANFTPPTEAYSRLNRIRIPVAGVLDNFNRADENPLTNSGKWTTPAFGFGGAQLISNQYGSSAGSAAMWNVQQYGNVECYAECPTLPGGSGSLSAWARMDGATGTPSGYRSRVVPGTNAWEIRRHDAAGGGTTIASGTSTQTFTAGDSIGIQVVGSMIYALHKRGANWYIVLSVFDSTYTTGYLGYADSTGTGRDDNFSGGQVVWAPAGWFDTEIVPRAWFDELTLPQDERPWYEREQLTFPLPQVGSLIRTRVLGTAAIGATQVKPASIARTRALGSPAVTSMFTVSPASLVHTRAQGSPKVNTTVATASLTHTRALGSPKVNTTILAASIVHTRAIGAVTVSTTVTPASIARTRALGAPTVSTTVLVASITHTRALGDPTADWTPPVGNINPASLTRTRTLGSPQVNVTVAPAALTHTRTLGSPSISMGPTPTSIVHTRALGSPSMAPSLSVTSLTHTRALGTIARVNTAPRPASLVRSRALGSPTLKVTVLVSSIVHSRALGIPYADDGIPDPTPALQQLAWGDFDFGMFTPEKVEN